MSYIEFKNVSKIYQMGEVEIKALDKMSFEIEKGEFVVVLGASGAGKTTVLKYLSFRESEESIYPASVNKSKQERIFTNASVASRSILTFDGSIVSNGSDYLLLNLKIKNTVSIFVSIKDVLPFRGIVDTHNTSV